MTDCNKDSTLMIIIRGACIGISVLLIGWMCSAVKTNETSIAVHSEQIINIYKVQSEIKETNKEMLKLLNEIRVDQLKRREVSQ